MKKSLFILTGIALFVVIVFLLAASPWILDFVKGKIETTVRENTGMDLRITGIRGNLLHSLNISGIHLDSAILAREIKIRYNAVSLLTRKIEISYLGIDGLELDIDRVTARMREIRQVQDKDTAAGAQMFSIAIRQLSVTNSKISALVNGRLPPLSLTLNGAITKSAMHIDSLLLDTDESHVTIRGSVPFVNSVPTNISFRGTVSAREFLLEGLSGKIHCQGYIAGSRSHPHISTNMDVDLVYNDARIQGAVSGSWQTPSLDSMRIAAAMKALVPGYAIIRNEEEEITLVFELSGRAFYGDIASRHDRMRIQGEITGDLEDPQVRTDFSGTLKFLDLAPSVKGEISYRGGYLDLKNIALRDRRITLLGNGTIPLNPLQQLDAAIVISSAEISLINDFMKDPLALQGGLDATIRVSGPIKDPMLISTVNLTNAIVYGERLQNAVFHLRMDSDSISIDSGHVESARGALTLDGSYAFGDVAYRVRVQSDMLALSFPGTSVPDTLPLEGRASLDISLVGQGDRLQRGMAEVNLHDIRYDTLLLGSYMVKTTINDNEFSFDVSNMDSTIHSMGEFSLDPPYPFTARLDIAHFRVSRFLPADSGFITARIEVAGVHDDLRRTSGQVTIDSIYIFTENGIVRNQQTILAGIRDKSLDIEDCLFSVHDQTVSVTGRLPLDPTREEMKIALKTPQLRIEDLVLLIPDAPPAGGTVQFDLTVAGLIQTPAIDGTITLRDMQMTLPRVRMDSVNAIIRCRDHEIRIEHIRGKVNKGTFDLACFAIISEQGVDSLAASCTISSVHIEDRSFGRAILSSDLKATAGKDVLNIEGEISIDDALYDIPFNMQNIIGLLTRVNQPPPEQSQMTKHIYCDIGISSARNIRIANNIARLEALVDLQIKGYLSRLNAYGTITTTDRGSVSYLAKKFDIVNALIKFDDPYKIDPLLELEARHSVTSIDGVYEINLRLNGTTEKWRLELTSTPPLPEQDIISLLLVGRRRPDTDIVTMGKNLNLKGTARDYALELARGTISRTAEEKLGLEKFTITGDLLDPRRLDIGIEKRIGERFTIIYGTGIETWELRRIGINYDITRNLSVFTLHDQENVNSSIDVDLHFKIK